MPLRWIALSEASSIAGTGGRPPNVEPSLRGFVEDMLRDSGLETFYRNDKSDPDQERLANLGELVTSAQQFEEEFDLRGRAGQANSRRPILREKLLGFLERIALVSDADSVDPEQGAVTLMTLHAAKGLEYPVVAMIGVEDGLLPHERVERRRSGTGRRASTDVRGHHPGRAPALPLPRQIPHRLRPDRCRPSAADSSRNSPRRPSKKSIPRRTAMPYEDDDLHRRRRGSAIAGGQAGGTVPAGHAGEASAIRTGPGGATFRRWVPTPVRRSTSSPRATKH